MNRNKAVIVLSHGSRNPIAREQFLSLVKSVNGRKNNMRIEGAHFELAKPDLGDTVSLLAGEGYKDLVIVPFFLMRGNHVERDIPELIEIEKRKNPELSFSMGTTLCPSELLVDLVIKRVEEVT